MPWHLVSFYTKYIHILSIASTASISLGVWSTDPRVQSTYLAPAPTYTIAMAAHIHRQHPEDQSRPVVEIQSSVASSSSSSTESYQYLSTAPTSRTSTKPSPSAAQRTHRQTRPRRRETKQQQQQPQDREDDHPPTITFFPPSLSASVSSVDTYDSLLSDPDPDNPLADSDDDDDGAPAIRLPAAGEASIPSALPPYRARDAAAEPALRPSDPYTFGRLFPSMDRLVVRHDDSTADGNMNLRVETVVAPGAGGNVAGAGPGPLLGRARRAATVQLFHLRMHDLARRDFSLRRYCRDSGREVCFSKRAYAPPSGAAAAKGGITRSVSAALRSVKTPFRRSAASSSQTSSSSPRSSSSVSRCRPSLATAGGSTTTANSAALSSSWSRRGSTASSSNSLRLKPTPAPLLVPTDTIKLEFSNYARVDVRRRHGRRYEFEWWGHGYAWRRAVDKTLGTVSFHLVRDGEPDAVAHIVPEVRSPNQVEAEERAGGWIPPCYMWISDRSVVEAVTDVAE